MKLPKDAIGISDILAHRDCPRRMSFSMKRHTEEGEPPEAAIEHAYGSCIHDVFEAIEKRGLSDDAAVQVAFDKWAWALRPEDLDTLKDDINTYRERDVIGVKTLATETEFRVPLMQRQGQTIYFRFKLDRLYQSTANAAVFIHRDYKSSRWRKTEEEVHEDLQMWAYNWGVFEFFPECEELIQHYDQLRHGVVVTRKSAAQREQMAEWLRRQVTAILDDDDFGDDGLLLPKFNEWCPWCKIKESCPVVEQLSDFALSRIDAIAKGIPQAGSVAVDAAGIESYVERLQSVKTAEKVLKEFEEAVKRIMRELPLSERERLGFKLTDTRADVYDEEALRQVHHILGDDFYQLVSFTKRRLNSLFDDDPRVEQIKNLARKEVTGDQLRKRSG